MLKSSAADTEHFHVSCCPFGELLFLLLHKLIRGVQTDNSSQEQEKEPQPGWAGVASPNSDIAGQQHEELFSELPQCCSVLWTFTAAPAPAWVYFVLSPKHKGFILGLEALCEA